MTRDEYKVVVDTAMEMLTTGKHNVSPYPLPHWEGEITSAKEFFSGKTLGQYRVKWK